jgi:hypothetical protein
METITAPRILFFGRNPAIMALVKLHIGASGYHVEGFLDESAVSVRVRAGEADLLILGGGVEDAPRVRFRRLCAETGVTLLEHFGGPGELVLNIRSALTASANGH